MENPYSSCSHHKYLANSLRHFCHGESTQPTKEVCWLVGFFPRAMTWTALHSLGKGQEKRHCHVHGAQDVCLTNFIWRSTSKPKLSRDVFKNKNECQLTCTFCSKMSLQLWTAQYFRKKLIFLNDQNTIFFFFSVLKLQQYPFWATVWCLWFGHYHYLDNYEELKNWLRWILEGRDSDQSTHEQLFAHKMHQIMLQFVGASIADAWIIQSHVLFS